MIKYILTILLSIILLSCSESTDPNYNDEVIIIENLSVKEAITQANEWRSSQPKITSYVTTEELIVEFPDGREVHKNLPDNEMYIAIAPYINYTHSCTNHYISSCKAELTKKGFKVTAISNNDTIINQNITSLNNGFIELWLPRDKTISISIIYGLLGSKEIIKTDKESRTCFTTFKLE